MENVKVDKSKIIEIILIVLILATQIFFGIEIKNVSVEVERTSNAVETIQQDVGVRLNNNN